MTFGKLFGCCSDTVKTSNVLVLLEFLLLVQEKRHARPRGGAPGGVRAQAHCVFPPPSWRQAEGGREGRRLAVESAPSATPLRAAPSGPAGGACTAALRHSNTGQECVRVPSSVLGIIGRRAHVQAMDSARDADRLLRERRQEFHFTPGPRSARRCRRRAVGCGSASFDSSIRHEEREPHSS